MGSRQIDDAIAYRYARVGQDAKRELMERAGSGGFSFHCCTKGTMAPEPRSSITGSRAATAEALDPVVGKGLASLGRLLPTRECRERPIPST